ncbi:MAG TPA: alpha/beta-hydrolase family protein [Ornithinibacter sp.]|nr:alpha/beta-hydrolase family protein [Ornithinibacter sp.]
MTVAFVESAAVRVRASPWAPTIGRPERILDRAFSGVGLTAAIWAFAASLVPSLLPRSAWLQGIVSGVTVVVGYGLGTGAQALWTYLGVPRLRGRWRTIVLTTLVGLGQLAALVAGWRQVGWQNEIRALFGMEPTSPVVWPVILVVTGLVAGVLLLLARAVRLVARAAIARFARRLHPRLALVLAIVLLGVVMWGLWTGVIVKGFFAGANAIFAPRDTTGSHSVNRPTAPERSGSASSLARWEDLGSYGRVFVRTGPTPAQLEAVNGAPAKEPIRVYAGLQSADTVQGRADLVLAELERTGAFDRKVLVVATTTGMGFLDRRSTDSLEYMWNGDTAIAGVQYSYLPSWISLLADQEAVVETSRVVFETVREKWATLPPDHRPALYLYGLSLGSLGVESVLTSVNIVNEPVDGALMVGPPFFNDMHRRLEAGRDKGSPAYLPVYENGRTVRFGDEEGGLQGTSEPWGPTRLVYLQHASDPVVFFSTDLAFDRPEWLQDDQRGPDVSPAMDWLPIVTMWQVLLDMPGAGQVPEGFGHMYSATLQVDAWAAVTRPPGWTAQRAHRIATLLEARVASTRSDPSWGLGQG